MFFLNHNDNSCKKLGLTDTIIAVIDDCAKKIVTLKDVIILSEKRRQVFEKRRLEGKTVDQIAEEMSLSPKTVERHLTLALKDLRHVIS